MFKITNPYRSAFWNTLFLAINFAITTGAMLASGWYWAGAFMTLGVLLAAHEATQFWTLWRAARPTG